MQISLRRLIFKMKSFGNVGTYVKFGKFRIKAMCLMANNFELLHLHFFCK